MVDMQLLKSMSIGFGTFIIAVAFIAIIVSNLNDLDLGSHTAMATPVGCNTLWNDSNCTTQLDFVLGNGSNLIGSLVTTWGSIILLGVVVVAVFVGIFVALSYMSNRSR